MSKIKNLMLDTNVMLAKYMFAKQMLETIPKEDWEEHLRMTIDSLKYSLDLKD